VLYSGYAMLTNTSFTTGCRTSEFSPPSPSLTFKLSVHVWIEWPASDSHPDFPPRRRHKQADRSARVPIENALGPEGDGIFIILSNFNHELWAMVRVCARAQRLIVKNASNGFLDIRHCEPVSSYTVIGAKLASVIVCRGHASLT
jgi:hypothetical protein